jgi:arsenite methyltransferase
MQYPPGHTSVSQAGALCFGCGDAGIQRPDPGRRRRRQPGRRTPPGRANAREAGAANAEFLKGHIEAIPLPSQSVDVIISNCVINLSGDKPAVLAESFRVLRPGGRLGVSDLLAEDHLPPAERIERGRQVGAIAGALSFAEYRDELARAGFTGIILTPDP